MKTKKIMIFCFTLTAVLFFNLGMHCAFALDYNVTVYNKTDKTAGVTLYTKDATGKVSMSNASPVAISPGGSSTLGVLAFAGGPCPSYVTGTVAGNAIVAMSCDGTEGSAGQARSCGSPSFDIIYNSTDKKYHFQKK
jgi:hypothetical protein